MHQTSVSKSFNELYDIKNNSFDIIRFSLAVMVIYSHSYPLFYGNLSNGDILSRLSNRQIDFGSFAIICFFIISGFLITQSLYSSKNYLDYFLKRILRIFPALIVSAVFFSTIIGLIVSEMSFYDYFRINNSNNVLSYIIDTVTLNVTGFSSKVNDVFLYNPYPSSINGSAWSLKHEFACYIIIAIMCFLLLYKHKVLLLAVSVILLIFVILSMTSNFIIFQSSWWVFIEPQQFIKFLFYFIMGSLIYVFRDKILYDKRFILLALLVLLIGLKTNMLQYAMLITLPYLVIATSIKLKFSIFRKYGDFSYGMYIYAFPIQQSLMYFIGDRVNLVVFFVMSCIFTLLFSVLSWHYVEKPSLNLKRTISFK